MHDDGYVTVKTNLPFFIHSLKNNNNIGDEGAVAIAKAMKLMLNIKRLV